jgi:hypothetical protein
MCLCGLESRFCWPLLAKSFNDYVDEDPGTRTGLAFVAFDDCLSDMPQIAGAVWTGEHDLGKDVAL